MVQPPLATRFGHFPRGSHGVTFNSPQNSSYGSGVPPLFYDGDTSPGALYPVTRD